MERPGNDAWSWIPVENCSCSSLIYIYILIYYIILYYVIYIYIARVCLKEISARHLENMHPSCIQPTETKGQEQQCPSSGHLATSR